MARELKLYLPIIFQDIAEYEALSNAETPLVEDLEAKVEKVIDESFLTTMSESRLVEWEAALGIIPSEESIERRRSVVLSRFRGTIKLSGTLIKAMVKAFTGGTSTVTFQDGILNVRVKSPTSTFREFSIDSLTNELLKRKPAHILMIVELDYLTWEMVRTHLYSWANISRKFTNWDELYLHNINEED